MVEKEILDYFTELLQGMLFRQLRNMIMGNTDIPLPSDAILPSAVIPERIPEVMALPESRSVLKILKVRTNDSNLYPRLAENSLRTQRIKTCPVGTPTCPLPGRRAHEVNVAITPAHSDKNNERGRHAILPLANRHSVSWSDIAKRGTRKRV